MFAKPLHFPAAAYAASVPHLVVRTKRSAQALLRRAFKGANFAAVLLLAVNTIVGAAALTNSASAQLNAVVANFVNAWHCLRLGQ